MIAKAEIAIKIIATRIASIALSIGVYKMTQTRLYMCVCVRVCVCVISYHINAVP